MVVHAVFFVGAGRARGVADGETEEGGVRAEEAGY